MTASVVDSQASQAGTARTPAGRGSRNGPRTSIGLLRGLAWTYCAVIVIALALIYRESIQWQVVAPVVTAALIVLGLTLGTVTVLNRTSGFRSTKDVRLTDALVDGVEAVALGLVSVLILLFVL